MNLHQLRIFNAVARLKSFTKASQELEEQRDVETPLDEMEFHRCPRYW